ncbi:MAG: flavin reductase [Oscillospiraceae bacterium]|jgi:flavin reductase (DIM6/NTAB) family NADH-FMN oxidoreductase RutF|nr:flavin reductase [Oscillospiraceae bacterium]
MFKEINIREIKESAVGLIADEWMLVASGNPKKYNMMTASWGALGEMWGADVATAVLRPQRYTREFMEANKTFSLSFYGGGAKKTIHSVCGSKSGRDLDKAEAAGLTPVFSDGTVYFSEARLVLVCEKIYTYDIEPEKFVNFDFAKWYPE